MKADSELISFAVFNKTQCGTSLRPENSLVSFFTLIKLRKYQISQGKVGVKIRMEEKE